MVKLVLIGSMENCGFSGRGSNPHFTRLVMEKYRVFLKNASGEDVRRLHVLAKDDADAKLKCDALAANCRDMVVSSYAYEKLGPDNLDAICKELNLQVVLTLDSGTVKTYYVKDPMCKDLYQTQQKLREMSFFLGGPVQVYSDEMDFTIALNAGHMFASRRLH